MKLLGDIDRGRVNGPERYGTHPLKDRGSKAGRHLNWDLEGVPSAQRREAAQVPEVNASKD